MKNKVRSALVLVAMLIVPFEAQAVKVFGNPDCGKWINQSNELHKAWLLGYLSGMTSAWEGTEDVLRDLSADQAFLWMDNYCRRNPLEKVGAGAHVLFNELLSRMRKAN